MCFNNNYNHVVIKSIVVAHYKEDLEWAKEIPEDFKIIIYNKSDPNHPNYLPNIGREAHTYVHHILTHYDNLDDFTIFLQGDVFKHTERDFFFKRLSMINEKTTYFGFGTGGVNIPKNDINNSYKTLFGEEFPYESHDIRTAALLCVSKNRILLNSKEFYALLMEKICSGEIDAYQCERLWDYIFSKNKASIIKI